MPQNKFNKLAGKHVLVIGGSSGIGFSVAEASIEAGASVTISSSNATRVQAAVKSLQSSYPGSKATGYAYDLSTSLVEQEVEKLFEQTGKVDHIVFTAADNLAMCPVQDITLEKIHAAGHMRFFAPLLVAKVGSRYLNAGPEASIILTTGSVADRPIPNWSIVAAYAAGLHGMVRNLAVDLKPVRVNVVSPWVTDSPLWDGMTPADKAQMFKDVSEKVPTGRVPSPDDVAEAYIWLMKDPNVTGTVARSESGSTLV